jgi:hypothetical protein
MPILNAADAEVDLWNVIPPDTVSDITPAFFVVAVDLGAQHDSTAVIVLDVSTCTRTTRKPDRWLREGAPVSSSVEQHFVVANMHRPRLGTTYPEIVRRVAAVVQALPHRPSKPIVVFDASGLGFPVLQLARQQGIRSLGITITAGNTATLTGENWSVPKALLVGSLRMAMHQGRLKVAQFAEREVLGDELASFTAKVSASGRASFEAAGQDHDDTVLSLAMAVFTAANRPIPPRIQRLGY